MFLFQLLNSDKSGVFSPACVSHTLAGVNKTEAAITTKSKIAVSPDKCHAYFNDFETVLEQKNEESEIKDKKNENKGD